MYIEIKSVTEMRTTFLAEKNIVETPKECTALFKCLDVQEFQLYSWLPPIIQSRMHVLFRNVTEKSVVGQLHSPPAWCPG